MTKPKVRDWECFECKHKWVALVLYPEVGELTGITSEKSVWCPKCNKRGSMGTPHRDMTEDDDLLELILPIMAGYSTPMRYEMQRNVVPSATFVSN